MRTIELKDIDKVFPSTGTQANRKARLGIRSGEIHAVVGENGAGKTTLMRILSGLETPDSGELKIDGIPAAFGSSAAAARIGMVHQHFLSFPNLSVAENILFGLEPRLGRVFVDAKAMRRRAAAAIERHGFALDPRRMASDLSLPERQQVEILRLLEKDCDVLILDEPTTILTEQETEQLFLKLRSLAASGRTVVIVTHKIKVVGMIADRVTVMRGGTTLGTYDAHEISEQTLTSMMMGSASAPPSPARLLPGFEREIILKADKVGVRRRHRGPAALEGISFSARRGEILGFCAVGGNGLSELEDILGGMRQPSEGSLRLKGRPFPRRRKAPWKAGGIAYVPSDRMERAVCSGSTLVDNLIALDGDRYFPHGFLDAKAAARDAAAIYGKAGLGDRISHAVRSLSGGTVQKAVLARELSDPPPDLAVLAEPTWGLDVLSSAKTLDSIAGLRNKGCAVVMLSTDLDELLQICDAIIVLHGGRIAGRRENRPGLTRDELGALMLGMARDEGEEGHAQP